MKTTDRKNLEFLNDLRSKYQHQPTFLQAVEEMAQSLSDLFEDPEEGDFFKRTFLVMAEPERVISFRIPWMDDAGNLRINRGWRVEFSRYASELRVIMRLAVPSLRNSVYCSLLSFFT